jgi:hypothetical protein
MPNYCENELRIRGNKKDALDFVEKIKLKDRPFCYSALFPIPKPLQEVTSGSEEIYYEVVYGKPPDWVLTQMKEAGFENPDKETIITWYAKRSLSASDAVEKVKAIANKYKQNKETYGHLSWYGWCISNWGTKWGACDSELLCSEEIKLKGKESWEVEYRFNTAWSPPKEALLHISEMFPNLSFVLKYWEGGCCFKGVFKFENGEVFKDITKEYTGHRGG